MKLRIYDQCLCLLSVLAPWLTSELVPDCVGTVMINMASRVMSVRSECLQLHCLNQQSQCCAEVAQCS